MKEKIRGPLLTLGAVVFLHAILSIYFWLTQFSVAALWRPTWELFGLVTLVVAWSLLWGRSRLVDRGLQIALTLLILLYFLLGLGQAFASNEFGYDVILVMHIPFVPVLIGMMYNSEPLGMFLLYMSVVIGAFLIAIGGSYVAIGRLVHYCSKGHKRRLVTAGAMGAYMLAVGIPLGVSPPLTRELIHQADMAINFDERINATAKQIDVETAKLRRVNPFVELDRKPNIFLFIVESYGHVMFSQSGFDDFRQVFIPQMEEELEDAGYTIRSRFLRAPVFGGSSWMADAALLCGVRVHNQRRYESLASSSVRCLPELLNEAGYYTVMGAANTTYIDEQIERMYPYDDYFYRDLLAYEGPRYGWSYMPDQYVINFVHERAVAPHLGEQPIFASYMLTTSHHPWNLLPPLVDDWGQIGDGSSYRRRRPKRFRNAFVRGEQFAVGYGASIEYVLATIRDYLPLLPEDDALIIILGDHQPRQPVALKEEDPWAVPIHILSRDGDLLDHLSDFDYGEGMSPPPLRDDDELGMEHFMLQLYKMFGAQPQ